MKPGWLVGLAMLAGCAREVALVKGVEPVIAGTLAGSLWHVEDINGGGVIDNARVEIGFDGETVSGRSGCNSFRGRWQSDGATIRLGPLASTGKACPPALMDMEGKFLATLAAVTRVRFDATGAAFLTAPDGRIVRLRRARAQPPMASPG